MAEASGSRTQPPRVGGERPVLKTGRATGPHSLPSLHNREERRVALRGFGGAEGGTPNGRPMYLAWAQEVRESYSEPAAVYRLPQAGC